MCAHLLGVRSFDLLVDDECLSGVMDGLSAQWPTVVHRIGWHGGSHQVGIGQAQVAEISAFASEIANLAIKEQCFFKELDRAAGLVQVGIGKAKVTKRNAFAFSMLQLPRGGQGDFAC